MKTIWHRVRGPFHALYCKKHAWERYNYNLAGCTQCGANHECADNLVDSKCPLEQLQDGTICCTITGLCIPVVRYAADEYIDHAGPESCAASKHAQHAAARDPPLYDEILATVSWFLTGKQAMQSKTEEITRMLQRCRCALARAFKQIKMTQVSNPKRLPCILTALATALHAVRPRCYSQATQELCQVCAVGIEGCLRDLRLPATPSHRTNLIVGLLYLMKQGLVINNVQWLPKNGRLQRCLPHENCLERCFRLSMKLICETENEIKLTLRQRIKKL